MSRSNRRRLGWSLFASSWLVAALLIWLRPPPVLNLGPLPSPNGYDAFQLAAGLLPAGLDTRYAEMDIDALTSLASAGQPALDELRRGLDLECRVPPVATVEDLEPRMDVFGALKRLGMVQAAAAELAGRRAEWDTMMAYCTNGIRYGQAASRGGLLIDRMVGNALEALAVKPLKDRVGALPGSVARRAAPVLAALSATREPLSGVIARETHFAKTAGGLRGRLAWMILGRRQLATTLTTFGAKDDAIARDLGTLAVRLAARAYEAEHGTLPAHGSELVPDYLASLPTDPEDGAPLPLPLGSARP